MNLSVILCTHNPRRDYLERTMESLAAQKLPHAEWEFLLVDNASNTKLADEISLDWHPNARVIREDQLGLTPARLRGIAESKADILCFADDDNVLASNYLEESLRIAKAMPQIGCWGGEIHGEYEISPPAWFKPYQGMLIVRPLARDTWGNAYRYDNASPCGAGLCVRRMIAEQFAAYCANSKLRVKLDRTGQSLSSGGDTDLAYTAIDMGYGTGRFKGMQLTHLIPARRLTEDYLIRLAEGMWESAVYLDSIRDETHVNLPKPSNWKQKIFSTVRWIKSDSHTRKMDAARARGLAKGMKKIAALKSGSP